MDVKDDQLRQLQEICDRATPGPWHTEGNPDQMGAANGVYVGPPSKMVNLKPPVRIVMCYRTHGITSSIDTEDDANAAFIAAAREAVPALLIECKRMFESLKIIACATPRDGWIEVAPQFALEALGLTRDELEVLNTDKGDTRK